MLDVGRVVRPHGLRGQVVVEMWTNRPERTRPGARLDGAGRSLVVQAASPLPQPSRWLVAFEGVGDREAAESLRDLVLRAEPMEVDDALWVHEMLGAPLYGPDGEVVGTVEAVEANPASDLLVLADGRVVPLTFVSRTGDGRLTVDGPPGLLES